ncbi:PqiA family protein [Vibrio cholerae]|nr:PqiA family protein [Vibrio cholerae]
MVGDGSVCHLYHADMESLDPRLLWDEPDSTRTQQ